MEINRTLWNLRESFGNECKSVDLIQSCGNKSYMKFENIPQSIALYGSETWTPRKLERKYLETFQIWCYRRMVKIKCTEKITNEHLESIWEKRTLLENILRRKSYWISHILRTNCLLYDAIEGQMTELKGVGRRRT